MCHWRGHDLSLRSYRLSVRTPRNCIGFLGIGYDMWHYYFIKFFYPTIIIDEEKNHPRARKEKANFVHQANIIHMTNDYNIH